MPTEKRESTYAVLSKIIKLKFHAQLQDSGIEFDNIYRMTNLVTGKESYLVVVNDKQILFMTTRDFIFHFSIFLTQNIKTLNERYDELTSIQMNEFTDDVRIEMRYKEVDCFRIKQTQLLEKMTEYKIENN